MRSQEGDHVWGMGSERWSRTTAAAQSGVRCLVFLYWICVQIAANSLGPQQRPAMCEGDNIQQAAGQRLFALSSDDIPYLFGVTFKF